MHVIDWVEAQNEDPIIKKTIEWMHSKKEKSLKYYLGDDVSTPEGLGFISRQKFLVLVNGKLYLNCKLRGEAEMTTVFVVPKAHRQKSYQWLPSRCRPPRSKLNCLPTLEWFWWPRMTMEAKSTVKNCEQCLRHDGESTRAPLVPIEAMGPMDLLHLDFTKIKISGDCTKGLEKKPEIVNVLTITDHFTPSIYGLCN